MIKVVLVEVAGWKLRNYSGFGNWSTLGRIGWLFGRWLFWSWVGRLFRGRVGRLLGGRVRRLFRSSCWVLWDYASGLFNLGGTFCRFIRLDWVGVWWQATTVDTVWVITDFQVLRKKGIVYKICFVRNNYEGFVSF